MVRKDTPSPRRLAVRQSRENPGGLRTLLDRFRLAWKSPQAMAGGQELSAEPTVEELLFDEDWYLWFYPDVRAAIEEGLWEDAFEHYLEQGFGEWRNPNATFDEHWYRMRHVAVNEAVGAGAFSCGYDHLLRTGAEERYPPSPFFDPGWYLDTNSDVEAAIESGEFRSAYHHFTVIGILEGREPGPDFDRCYLEDNPEARAAIEAGRFAGPFHHYMYYGILNGCALRIPVEPATDAAALSRLSYHHEAESRLRAFLASGEELVLEGAADPLLSVVIVTYDTASLLYLCLSALRDHADVPCEVIVVDNASKDETGELLARVRGPRVVRNPKNEHFLRGSKQGAEMAEGRFLLFLNSDAIIRPRALSSALSLLESDSGIGLVGGKLISPNGLLQEAGAGFDTDAHPYAFGRGDMPYSPAYMCQRDVAYCSAAFALTPRRLFSKLGGFDPLFAPAYFEDADYCFRLWRAGWRVVYDPDAICTHVERASSSRSSTTEALFARNQIMFRSRYRYGLDHMPPVSGSEPLPPAMGNRRERILFIDDWVPVTRLGSGLPRSRMMVLALVELGFDVTILPMNPDPVSWDEVYRQLPRTVECFAGWSHLRLQEFLERRSGKYRYLWVSRFHNVERIRDLYRAHPRLFTGMKIIYDSEAITADRDVGQDLLAGVGAPLPARLRLLEAEVRLPSLVDRVVAISERDRARFAEQGHDVVLVTETIAVGESSPRPFADRSGLLFVGAVYDEGCPNYDSLRWFLRKVLPILARRCDLRLQIAGRWARVERPRFLDHPRVDFLGEQDDLTDLYDRARVFVAPTRFSAGTPHKVIEASAHGLPAMATEQLVEQLGWTPGREICSAPHTDPAAFAAGVQRLYQDEALWTTVRDGVLERIAEQYSQQRLLEDLARVL